MNNKEEEELKEILDDLRFHFKMFNNIMSRFTKTTDPWVNVGIVLSLEILILSIIFRPTIKYLWENLR